MQIFSRNYLIVIVAMLFVFGFSMSSFACGDGGDGGDGGDEEVVDTSKYISVSMNGPPKNLDPDFVDLLRKKKAYSSPSEDVVEVGIFIIRRDAHNKIKNGEETISTLLGHRNSSTKMVGLITEIILEILLENPDLNMNDKNDQAVVLAAAIVISDAVMNPKGSWVSVLSLDE